MNSWTRSTCLCILVALAPEAALAQCQPAFSDPAAQRDLAALARVASIEPVWDTYTPRNHALLLVADSTHRGRGDTPVCAAIWRHQQPLEIVQIAQRPRLSTPLYGMVNTQPLGADAPEWAATLAASQRPDSTLAAILRARNIDRVIVLPFPMDFDRLGRLGAMMKQAGANPALLQADFAAHEGFHLHVQFPTWLGQGGRYAWTSWDRQPDRVQLRERCYAGSPAIIEAVQREHAALLAAFDALDSIGTAAGRQAVQEHAARFVALRRERYALLDTVRVGMNDASVTCAAAETVMELQEGTAQWVGHATTVRAGLVTREGKRGSYARPQAEAFYQFGPLQLWVVDALVPDDTMRELTAALARSRGPDAPSGSVFAVFQRHAVAR